MAYPNDLIPGKLYKLERDAPVAFDKVFITKIIYKDSIVLYLKEEKNSDNSFIVNLLLSYKDKIGFFQLHRDNIQLWFKEI